MRLHIAIVQQPLSRGATWRTHFTGTNMTLNHIRDMMRANLRARSQDREGGSVDVLYIGFRSGMLHGAEDAVEPLRIQRDAKSVLVRSLL